MAYAKRSGTTRASSAGNGHDRDRRTDHQPPDTSRAAVLGAAGATAGAGGVHLAIIGEHFAEGLFFGLAFALMATAIQVDVTPAGLERVEPAEAVVSLVRPRPDEPIRASFCDDVRFYRSASVARPWLSGRPDAIVVPVVEAFELGAHMAATLFPAAHRPR